MSLVRISQSVPKGFTLCQHDQDLRFWCDYCGDVTDHVVVFGLGIGKVLGVQVLGVREWTQVALGAPTFEQENVPVN
jgi:hypothetical protein